MLRASVSAALVLASSAFWVHAAPQGSSLAQQLHATYLETTFDGNGMKVTKPGSTLVVQLDGVQGNPRKNNLGPFENTFQDGQITVTEKKSGLGGYLRKQTKIALGGQGAERPLATGAKVYLLSVEFQPNADSIALTVQTCGDCDPKVVDPMNEPYRAKVTFKFVHGALAATDLKHVQQAIDQVFKFADAGSDQGAATGAGAAAEAAPQGPPPAPAAPPAQPQQFAPLAPPPPPPVDQKPRVIKLGMPTQEVKDAFGEPDSIIEGSGGRVIYLYKDKKVTFVGGKVSDIDVR